MNTRRICTATIVAAILVMPTALHAQTPLGTAFTYQGELKRAGEPVDDTADFEFTLWDADSGGNMIGSVWPVNNATVVGGLFTVEIDFGVLAFNGENRWLEIDVRSPAGGGEFTTLSPRQPLTATPYALYALSGPGSGGFWAANGDDIYNTNTGNVGIGTTNPQAPLHVWSDGSPTLRARNASASGGTAILAEATADSGFSAAVNAYVSSPDGRGIDSFNEAESGNAYAFFGETGSPDGVAVHGHASNGSEYSTGIGVYGRSNGDYGAAGVYGEATNTGTTYGVRGVSAHGTGVRGEQTDSGNYGILGRDQYGVEGHGDSAGGHFEDADGTSSADVAWGYFGINAEGLLGGGVFSDSDGSANADIAHGHRGLRAGGAEYGGLFHDTDGSGQAYVGYGDRGIEAEGSQAGGYFRDTDGTGEAYVGYGNHGIEARGDDAGGYFADTTGSGYAYVGDGNRGISAFGGDVGGYFEVTGGTGRAYVGYQDSGIQAYGYDAGGYFRDTDSTAITYVARGDLGIDAEGSEAGGYFEDSDGSGEAYLGYGNRGIEARGDDAGGYFADTANTGWAFVGEYGYGIDAAGEASGGFFKDLDSSAWTYVGFVSYKVYGNGTVSFVQNHPDDADKVIVYACPEGDEVATYTRGTARLVNGEAVVPLGETFKWVTNPDIGLTAHLTLRGDSPGLYVESLSTQELVVREVGGGTSDVAFDYIVYGLRIGFEEVGVVREKEREAYIPSMADHRALYERKPELRDYNALERFKRMRAALGEPEVDLSASQALRDAIVEFDPAVHSLDDRRELEAPEPIEMGEDRPRAQRPYRPELVDPKDTELAELRARVEALEALVARLATPQNGGEQ